MSCRYSEGGIGTDMMMYSLKDNSVTVVSCPTLQWNNVYVQNIASNIFS